MERENTLMYTKRSRNNGQLRPHGHGITLRKKHEEEQKAKIGRAATAAVAAKVYIRSGLV